MTPQSPSSETYPRNLTQHREWSLTRTEAHLDGHFPDSISQRSRVITQFLFHARVTKVHKASWLHANPQCDREYISFDWFTWFLDQLWVISVNNAELASKSARHSLDTSYLKIGTSSSKRNSTSFPGSSSTSSFVEEGRERNLGIRLKVIFRRVAKWTFRSYIIEWIQE